MTSATTPSAPTFAAVLVMAGQGTRFGSATPKAFVPLAGEPLWHHAARTLTGVPGCRELILVVAADRVEAVAVDAAAAFPRAVVVAGGARRQDSVRNGLAAVGEVDVVAIHDAARPLVRPANVRDAVCAAAAGGAALVAVAARDTIKRVADGVVAETLDRSVLWHAQTPQCLRLEVARRVHADALRLGLEVTDDAALAEHFGVPVTVTPGHPWNFKVTVAEDLVVAEALLVARGAGGAVNAEQEQPS